jgi:hypothetical protein
VLDSTYVHALQIPRVHLSGSYEEFMSLHFEAIRKDTLDCQRSSGSTVQHRKRNAVLLTVCTPNSTVSFTGRILPASLVAAYKARLYITPILLGGEPSHAFTFPDHQEECCHTGNRHEARKDETVLQAHVCIPRCNGVAESESNGVPDDDDRGHGLAADLLEAVDCIRERY